MLRRGLHEPGWPEGADCRRLTAFGTEHFELERDPHDPFITPLPDLFELDLNTSCWVQAGFLSLVSVLYL